MRDSVFVSYCHKDGDVLNDLRIALAAMPEHVHATIWDDTRITPSSQWRSEIEEAISTAAAAVLLLSPGSSRRALSPNTSFPHCSPPQNAAKSEFFRLSSLRVGMSV